MTFESSISAYSETPLIRPPFGQMLCSHKGFARFLNLSYVSENGKCLSCGHVVTLSITMELCPYTVQTILLRRAIRYHSYVKIIFTLCYDDGIWEILIKNISCVLRSDYFIQL